MIADEDIEDSETDNTENHSKLFVLVRGRVKVGVITSLLLRV